MKWTILILLLSSSNVYGQGQYKSTTFDKWAQFDQFKREDSLEGLYVSDTLFQIITDTLPLNSSDENSGWREMKLVNYFFDNFNTLRRVSFRNGENGYYYFYFEESLLRKAVFLRGSEVGKYYFTTEENKLSFSEIELLGDRNPVKKNQYKALSMGKDFFDKFKTLY